MLEDITSEQETSSLIANEELEIRESSLIATQATIRVRLFNI